MLQCLQLKSLGSKQAQEKFGQPRARPGELLKAGAQIGLDQIGLVPPLGHTKVCDGHIFSYSIEENMAVPGFLCLWINQPHPDSAD